MGMAASQARYLALVARKSNCEYEGQQINQARTALSNQSANLFNQMLGLKVPIPPSTQDFTKTQYSYTDGVNASTIDSWQQLAVPEEEYNYVVTSHYYTDVYTGSQKKLSDPQVQYTTTGINGDYSAITNSIQDLTSSRIEYDKIADEYNKAIENYNAAIAADKAAKETLATAQEALASANQKKTEAETAYNAAVNNRNAYKPTYENAIENRDGAQEEYNDALQAKQNKESYASEVDYSSATIFNKPVAPDTKYTIGTDTYTPYNELNETIKNSIDSAMDILISNGISIDYTKIYYNEANGIAFQDDLESLVARTSSKLPVYQLAGPNSIESKNTALNNAITTSRTEYEQAEANAQPIIKEYNELDLVVSSKDANLQAAKDEVNAAQKAVADAGSNQITAATNLTIATAKYDEVNTEYGPTVELYKGYQKAYNDYQVPEYIGNSELTLLESLTSDEEAEIKQVVATMTELDQHPAINNCFDKDGNYLGGVYKFKMNGITYYTCFEDLNNSYTSGTGINHIDGQIKLSYYNSSYVSTKIEKTEKALIETDGNGRFTSIRFESDSIKYNLTMETITDDVAYEDAMNQYIYENAKYDKMIQDINAKTSIIQHQDQQLELRLKQLDTEQNALSTEIDAVSKIVKDNVEKSFKTFSG